jgi:threonine aldolase
LKEQGVLASGISATTVRLVTHLDVDDDGVDRAIRAFRAVSSAD